MMRALARSFSLPSNEFGNFFHPGSRSRCDLHVKQYNIRTHADALLFLCLVRARRGGWSERRREREREIERAVAECAWHFLHAAPKTAVTLSDKSMPDANSSLGGRFIAHFVIGRARLRPENLTSACLPACASWNLPAICACRTTN
jgi:hypothetical protein